MSILKANEIQTLDGYVVFKQGQTIANDSVEHLSQLLAVNPNTKAVVNVLNYHTGLEGGGGVFYWDATKAKSEHNGGTVIDPTVVFPTDWSNQTQLGTWFDTANAGVGCWIRQYDGAVNVVWFGAKDNSDISASLKSCFTTTDDLVVDLTEVTVSESLIISTNKNVDFCKTRINYPSLVSLTLLTITGKATIKGGVFVGLNTFDSANAPITYQVILVTSSGVVIDGVSCEYTKKVFINAKDVTDITIKNCVFDGKYPTITGQNLDGSTGHFCIVLDPDANHKNSDFLITSNKIKNYVQGVAPGNYGVGGVISGLVITDNVFTNMQDHAVYTNFSNGAVIVGNSFVDCHMGVVVSGNHNNVSSNVFYSSDEDGTFRRAQSGIDVRSGSFNIVSSNNIKLHFVGKQAIAINLQYLGSVVEDMIGNSIVGNTIEILSGAATGIRAISLSSFGEVSLKETNISDNIVIGQGSAVEGLIYIGGSSSASYNHSNNKVDNNTLRNTVPTINNPVIYCSALKNSIVSNNSIQIDCPDAVSETAYYGIVFVNVKGTSLINNSCIVSKGFGANCRIYEMREYSSCSNNKVKGNMFLFNDSNINLFSIPVTTVAGGNCLLDVDWLGTSTTASTVAAAAGSKMIRRTLTEAKMYFRATSTESDWDLVTVV